MASLHPHRVIAAQAGAKHYEGPACRVCGTTVRYTVSGGCVACTKRRATERQRWELDMRLKRDKP